MTDHVDIKRDFMINVPEPSTMICIETYAHDWNSIEYVSAVGSIKEQLRHASGKLGAYKIMSSCSDEHTQRVMETFRTKGWLVHHHGKTLCIGWPQEMVKREEQLLYIMVDRAVNKKWTDFWCAVYEELDPDIADTTRVMKVLGFKVEIVGTYFMHVFK
jgi:hypothetical protein